MQLRFVARNGRKILQQAVACRGRLTVWKDVPFVMVEEDADNTTVYKVAELNAISFGIEPWKEEDNDGE